MCFPHVLVALVPLSTASPIPVYHNDSGALSAMPVHRKLPACSPLEVDARDPRAALYAVQGPLPFGTFMQEMKRQAIEHLAKALAGDVLAAEYTLLTLLSRAYVRTEVRHTKGRA